MQAERKTTSPLLGPLIALALSVAASVACLFAIIGQPERRDALYYAGDAPLPSAVPFQHAADVGALLERLGDSGRAAYAAMLGLDNLFVALVLASVLCLAWVHVRQGRRAWFRLLVAAGLLYAAADAAENLILGAMLAGAGAAPSLAGWAVAATSAKWLLAFCLALAVGAGFVRLIGAPRAWGRAFFQDIPSVIDSLWRRAEYVANREFRYVPAQDGAAASVEARPCWRKPAFLWFAITLGFVAYGPTPDAFCSLAPGPWAWVLPLVTGALSLTALVLLWPFARQINRAIESRFSPMAATREREERRDVTRAALIVGSFLAVVPLLVAAASLFYPALETLEGCKGAYFSPWSWVRLAVCLGAIALFARLCGRSEDTGRLVRWQAGIAITAAAIFWFLASPADREADGTGYRHLFGVLAPALLAVIALAPWVARWLFSRDARKMEAVRDEFRELLGRRELFVRPGQEPAPTTSRVLFAAAQGLSYRALQVLLPPGLLAFVAPAEWLDELAAYGFALALLLATWGNLWRRWEQMVRQADRWFLSGTALFVSLFVIAVGLLRLARVDYVTTIVDAAPFGVLFALVAMSYVLSWLVEYWVNRVLAVRLLELLGDPARRTWIDYPAAAPGEGILVDAAGRRLGYHGLGRFVVVGTLLPGHRPTTGAPEARTAFHTYSLFDLFRALARRDSDAVAEVVRFSSLYFYVMNLLIVAVFAAFAVLHWRAASAPPLAVVAADGDAGPGSRDLAQRLLAQRARRPALVVVASGGGTRAALYTSHVLEGLHELRVDRDIVLASGVSGGGVALAYFVARYDELAGSRRDRKQQGWRKFRDDVGGNLIRDVLEGADEWRIFRAAPLTFLLSESFDRHLLEGAHGTMLGTDLGPALILNTTITGHPAEDSEVLVRTLDPAGDDCREADRPYNKMAGGRLIFTNLKATGAFPRADAAAMPDTRLPYVIVTDPGVEIAPAAALNANFPPVFPNARVELRGRAPSPCRVRSYYVTDGGAEENLGLVSALYGVLSALEELKQSGKRRLALRPLHFVIAEASATGYDYTQDRGISAGIGGGKERLTGGLTNELVRRVAALYAELGGDPKEVHYHYLALPLTFRARGGLGTHWMLADKFTLHDPRPRAPQSRLDLRPRSLSTVTISSEEIRQLWTALHDTRTPFCTKHAEGTIVTDRVQRWICGAPGSARRDPHIEAWQQLVAELRRPGPTSRQP